jgi:hypothetical protein
MDDIRELYRETPDKPVGEQEDRDTIHCQGEGCGEVFVVEHVSAPDAWTCPKCSWRHPNLHRQFLIIGVVAAVLALAAVAVLVLFLRLHGREVWTPPYIMWCAVQFGLATYLVLAVFGDSRAYGLASLRAIIPLLLLSLGVFGTLLGARLWAPLLYICPPVFLGGYAYVGWVFVHAFRMARMHRPREAVVRPMYTIISIVVHAIVLTIFTFLVVQEQKRTPGTSMVEFGRPGGFVQPVEQFEEVEKPEEEEVKIEQEDVQPEFEEIETPKVTDIDYETDTDLTIIKVDRKEKPREKLTRRVPKPYEQRFNRQDALEQGGGSDQTEWAVILALRWLKEHQNEDGSWGEEPLQPSMTGLALLCFLGHGEDHLSEEFGGTVRKALEWLKGNQDAEGLLARGQGKPVAYQHGIATYALAEAYAMTGLEPLQPVVKNAVKVILQGQTDEGGWYYGYTKGGITVRDYETGREFFISDWKGGDTSVSGWQIQALTATWYSGMKFPNNALENARKRALRDITSRINSSEGWSGYQNTSPEMRGEDAGEKQRKAYGMTAVATLCLQFLGAGQSSEVTSLLTTMKRYRFDWDRTEGGWQQTPLYAWYYVTQAKFNAGAPRPMANADWVRWNQQMTTTLLKQQHRDGSWGFPKLSREGTEHVEGQKNKPVYSTALCCLMLEVYYRHLPTYTIH